MDPEVTRNSDGAMPNEVIASKADVSAHMESRLNGTGSGVSELGVDHEADDKASKNTKTQTKTRTPSDPEYSKYPRVLFVEKKWDDKDKRFVETTIDNLEPSAANEAIQQEHSFAFHTKTDESGEQLDRTVTIKNPELKKLILRVLHGYPGHWKGEDITVSGNFSAFVHNWAQLEELAQINDGVLEPERLARQDLRDLLTLLKEKATNLKKYFEGVESFRKDKSISYDFLWSIFPPGCIVYSKDPIGAGTAYLVNGCHYRNRFRDSEDREEVKGVFVLKTWTYDFDGGKFNRYPFHFHIEDFPEKVKISQLPCYPISYHSENAIRQQLIQRGRRFREIYTKPEYKMYDYDGDLLHRKASGRFAGDEVMLTSAKFLALLVESSQSLNGEKSYAYYTDDASHLRQQSELRSHKGRVMVDAKLFIKYSSKFLSWHFNRPRYGFQDYSPDQECECPECQENEDLQKLFKLKYDNLEADENGEWQEFEEDQYLICFSRAHGYCLDKKEWVQMDINCLKDIGKLTDSDAFHDLILRDDYIAPPAMNTKSLIKALIEQHAKVVKNGVGKLRDFVEGKGEGLVILLYGTSGNGKTLTAECATKATGRPLIKVSIADFGTDVTSIEPLLETSFELAAAWGAILLFDEADIFLEKRTTSQPDLTRNAVVSVFLRVLEYYKGILILATNRVKIFDPAVKSRVNLGVSFGPLLSSDQRRIFNRLFGRLDPKSYHNKKEIDTWLDQRFVTATFTGREIRNLISSALLLAKAGDEKLRSTHLDAVMEGIKAFHMDMKVGDALATNRGGFDVGIFPSGE